MSPDMFGNLRDWGEVLQKLDDAGRSGKLDKHQPGLIRVLRYHHNWRLREAVLNSLKEITRPSPDLLSEVVNLAMDEGTYYEARILAVRALPGLLKKLDPTCTHEASTRSAVIERMQAILASPQPPILHNAVNESLQNIV